MPVDFAGGTLTFNQDSMIEQAESLFLNEYGDSMKGDLNMNGNKILNVPDPKLDGDAVNKKYVDAISNMKELEDRIMKNVHSVYKIRLTEYLEISKISNIQFWVSAHYPYGFHEYTNWIIDLVPERNTIIYGDLKIKFNEHPAFYFSGKTRIISHYKFGTVYTFFLLAKKKKLKILVEYLLREKEIGYLAGGIFMIEFYG